MRVGLRKVYEESPTSFSDWRHRHSAERVLVTN
jgi:hypothetical protein